MTFLGAIYILETVLAGALFYLAWRRSRPAAPPFRREFLIITALIAAQAAAQFAHFTITDTHHRVVGLAWLTQAVRAACLLPAVALWFRLVRWQTLKRVDKGLLVVAVVALAFGRGGFVMVGTFILFALSARLRWPQEVHGFSRGLVLLLAPILFALVTVQTQTTIRPDGGNTILTVAHLRPPLLTGTLSISQLIEMKLAEPLDRVVETILSIFRAQILILFFKLLTLPVRLRGMSLKRRFMFNYVFIRLVPATLSTITIALLIYFGYGLSRVAQVRHDLESTLNREFDLAVYLTQAVRPDTALVPFRAWLGPEGERSHFVLKSRGPDGSWAAGSTPGTPEALLSDSLFAPMNADSAAGLVEAGGRLYLVAEHRAVRPAGALARIAVPLDSLYLARLAERAAVGLRVVALPGLFIGPTEVRSAADTSWTPARIGIDVPPPGPAGTRFVDRPRYLGRAFLPVGDWRNLKFRGLRGAVQLTAVTALRGFSISGERAAFLFTTNAWTIFFLVIMVVVIALTESLAVRTGRGIITAILAEVTSLRDAVLRIGRGDLDYRIPVHGKDEIAALSSSVNEMAADLKRQQAEIVEKERLEADLMVAREIQQRFLPQSAPTIAGLDVAGVSIPSREVGGDLFYFLPLEEGRLGVALGDVSGKSVPAALLMSNVLAALRTEARLHANINDSLGRINELIVEQVEPGRFVTLFYGIVDSGAGEIHYASAGHNPPLKVDGSGGISWLEGAGVPLGVVPATRYTSATVPFRPGDVLVLYSDGITEAMSARTPAAGGALNVASDDDMEFFDEDRLAEAVIRNRNRSASEIVAAILEAVNQFARGTPQADDMTLVVIRMK